MEWIVVDIESGHWMGYSAGIERVQHLREEHWTMAHMQPEGETTEEVEHSVHQTVQCSVLRGYGPLGLFHYRVVGAAMTLWFAAILVGEVEPSQMH